MGSAFLDADVILDLFIRREPHHAEALRLFSRLRRAKFRCVTSPLVIANVHYVLGRLRTKRYALGRIGRLRRLVGVAPLTEAEVDAAITSPYRDFEDSVQYHCALAAGFDTLITRNTRDYPKGRLNIVTPRQYLDMIGTPNAETSGGAAPPAG